MLRYFFVFGLISCSTSDKSIILVNNPPEASIQSPVTGAEFIQYVPINFMGYINDPQESAEELKVTWTSDLDGVLNTEPATYDGTTFFTESTLSPGTHTISLLVLDSRSTSAEDSISIYIESAVKEPSIAVRYPLEDEYTREFEETHFEALVEDEQDEAEDLFVLITSNINGDLCSGNPDEAGIFVCDLILDVGTHQLIYEVTDTSDNIVSTERTHVVVSISAIDDDSDGFTEDQGDCDDTNSSVFPGAIEYPNGTDDDCDGLTDNGTSSYDDDGDCSCESLPCYGSIEPTCENLVGGDCNDEDTLFFPDQIELCDGVDNNCDGLIDDNSALDALIWYRDFDNDTYGDPNLTVRACFSAPSGYVADNSDCDDTSATFNPTTIWYLDNDGDTFGGTLSVQQCVQPASNYTLITGDCNDLFPSAYPGGTEVCDGIDNNCDGTTDEPSAVDALLWYADSDGDGFAGMLSTTSACTQPSGYFSTVTDCNDSDNAINPNAIEVCDNIDNDCDISIDENVTTTYYLDNDGDGFGYLYSTIQACSLPSGYVTNSTDCNDSSSAIKPTANEICDGIDNNCNGVQDDSDPTLIFATATRWYVDSDGDGYGNPLQSLLRCVQPSGYVTNSTDCNDTTSLANPNRTEVCDGIDNDCDNTSDEANAGGCTTYYRDYDGDGYGDVSYSQCTCSASGDFDVTNYSDCYDNNSSVHPGQTSYFSVHRGDGSYDYNCDNSQEKQLTSSGSCNGVTNLGDCTMNTAGWNGSVPSCGSNGNYITDNDSCSGGCKFLGIPTCCVIGGPSYVSKPQKCR